MVVDAVEILDLHNLSLEALPVYGVGVLHRQEHLVLACVLQGDKLQDLGVIAVGFKQEGPQAIRHHLRLLPQMNAKF